MLAAGAALLGGRLGWERLAEHPAMAVREVVVRGAEVVAADEVLALAAVEEGASWLRLDADTVARRVHAHPWIDEVRVRRPWPGRVRLDVRECVPVARVVVGNHEYALDSGLRILPEPEDGGEDTLPLIRTGARPVDPEALARGLAYVQELRKRGVGNDEPVELEVGTDRPDRIRLPERGFAVTVEEAIPPGIAARNVAAFLETLDGTGAGRGTLRLITEKTAVWKAAA